MINEKSYGELQHDALLDARIDTIANTDTVSITVKYFTLAEMREIANDVGVPAYGSRATIAYRIQRARR